MSDTQTVGQRTLSQKARSNARFLRDNFYDLHGPEADTVASKLEECADHIEKLEKQLAERDAALARCVEALSVAEQEIFQLSGEDIENEIINSVIRPLVSSLPASAQATAKVQQWQPIETAPKDGTNILLVNRAGNVATGLWQGNGEYEGWWLRGGNRPNTFFNHHYGPSYWMPLPEPPTEAIREEQEGK